MPNPWDPGTTMLLASLGFKALATSSAGFAFSRGLPDGGVPFDMMIQHCQDLVSATDLPMNAGISKRARVTVPDSAGETIFAAEAAGLAGCSIEDFSGDTITPSTISRLLSSVSLQRAEAAKAFKEILSLPPGLKTSCMAD